MCAVVKPTCYVTPLEKQLVHCITEHRHMIHNNVTLVYLLHLQFTTENADILVNQKVTLMLSF